MREPSRSAESPVRTPGAMHPRRPTITRRTRVPAALLSLAVLTGAAGAPSVAQAAPAAGPAATSTTGTETEGLRLDRSEAQAMRERAARIAGSLPAGADLPGRPTLQATTVHPEVRRLAGQNRYATAADLAQTYWVEEFWNEDKYGTVPGAKFVFVATGAAFADSLSGGAAAAAFGGPMLLTKKDELPPETAAALDALDPDVVILLGGTEAVSADVEAELEPFTTVPGNVHRIAGANRYEVSADLAGTIGWSPVAYVASGENFPDGLTGGAAAGAELAPLLITKQGSVPEPVLDVLREVVIPTEIRVLGGPVAVSDDVVEQLDDIAPVTRIGGRNRYAVAEAVADLHPSNGGATAASGDNWPDALAGTAFAGLVGDKLLLLKATGVPAQTERTVLEHQLVNIDALGGDKVLPEAILDELRALDVTVE